MGVWASAGRKLALRIAAVGLIGKEVLGFVVTLFFPIHLRGVEGTRTDTMHAILTGVGVLLMLIVGGVLTGLDQPNLEPNLPTPWMGVWERINIYAYMLWVVVLAIALLRAQRLDNTRRQPRSLPGTLRGV